MCFEARHVSTGNNDTLFTKSIETTDRVLSVWFSSLIWQGHATPTKDGLGKTVSPKSELLLHFKVHTFGFFISFQQIP